MARLHNFSSDAIAAIMTRHSQPQRYGRSRQNQQAVALIHQQHAIDAREQSTLLAAALVQANPDPSDVRSVLHEIRKANGWTASNIDHATNEWKRARRAQHR